MGRVTRIDPLTLDDDKIASVAEVLISGGVAVFPTDTVYGIGVSALACDSPEAIFRIKRRPPQKTVPWLVSDISAIDTFGRDVPDYAYRLAEAYWPGALTLVVPASSAVPEAYRASDGTIALRSPASPLALALIRAAASPLVTSSANTSASPAPRSAAELEKRIVDEADVTVDGGVCEVGFASTVVICTGDAPVIAREGAITDVMVNETASALKGRAAMSDTKEGPRS